MKAIFYNLSSIEEHGRSHPHGGGEYSKVVLEGLCNSYQGKVHINVISYTDAIMEDWLKKVIKEAGAIIVNISSETEISNILYDAKQKYDDVVFFDGNIVEKSNRFNYVDGIIYIGTYHGPRWMELYPQKNAYLYSDNLKKSIKSLIKYLFRTQYIKNKHGQFQEIFDRFDYLIGASDHSVYSLMVLYAHRYDSRLKKFYSPPKHIEEGRNIQNEVPGNRGKYILLVSGNRPEKNIYMGLKACDELFSEGYLSDYTVVVTGGVSNRIVKRIKNRSKFEFLQYVSTNELESAYKECDLFLYPTLNEGFGYPPLEAMKYNKTCIISAVCSLTELYGDSVYYINPYDLNEIKTRILFASTTKIDERVILERYNAISEIQESDLHRVIDFICNAEQSGERKAQTRV